MSQHPYITPDPGRANCRRCHKYNIVCCPVCHKCSPDSVTGLGGCCKCTACSECHSTHPAQLRCTTCGHCRRSGLCICRGKPHSVCVTDLIAPTPSSTSRMDCISRPRRLARDNYAALQVALPWRMVRPLTVEIEVASIEPRRAPRPVISPMEIVGDGSVRGPNPMEIVYGPTPALQLPRAISELAAWLTASGASINMSCGVHVHVGALDLTAQHLQRLCQLWLRCERWVYALCDARRPYCRYSVAWPLGFVKQIMRLQQCAGRGEIMERMTQMIYSKGLPPVPKARGYAQVLRRGKSEKRVEARYYGLNLASWFYRGTLEFRMHEACLQKEELLRWMQLCGWIVELATRLTAAEVDAIHAPADLFLHRWPRRYGTFGLPPDVGAWAMEQRAHSPAVPKIPADYTSLQQDLKLYNGLPYTQQEPIGWQSPVQEVDWIEGWPRKDVPAQDEFIVAPLRRAAAGAAPRDAQAQADIAAMLAQVARLAADIEPPARDEEQF